MSYIANMAAQRHQLLTPLTPSMPICPHLVQEPIDSLPMTPPDNVEDVVVTRKPDSKAIKLALHVISTERLALEHLEATYQNEESAQQGMSNAITQITQTCENHGKVVVCGVGKSGKIGKKLEATFNSLGIHSTFLHPTEALHGDLGVIKPKDTVLMITFSGRTPELSLLLPHIPTTIPLIILTRHLTPATCPLIASRPNSILLPAPIHESEQISFGLSAPTTSTTVALAIGDALALAVAERLHTAPGTSPSSVFLSHHPGGAIGAPSSTPPVPRMSDLAVSVALVPIAIPQDGSTLRNLDVLRTAVRSPGGWVRVTPDHIVSPRRIAELSDLHRPLDSRKESSLVVERADWISVLGDCAVGDAREWILKMRADGRGQTFLMRGTILGIVDSRNEVSGVVEIEDVVGEDLSG
jgi:D-arabinose 5-phosphate isomerase GutQ